ncbi:DUF2834 domain-containing protein [Paracoccus sp. SCSIO 75233]|uniref:DUF2834 domain-containing protein n=1 Tax=Paracoccus sp. SCSIO 75233 TaxID=3017782 RepID=UPI0022F04B3B|nr:DUF2834 domain-containing protein [Paracoccus sp. SCSIO 75233]WBU53778.1 DUF2834 domain-containing protein [Paracoccus sp. SCSIO 75233]
MGFELTPMRICWIVLALIGAIIGLRLPSPDATSIVALVTLGLWCLVETTFRRNWWAFLTLPAMFLGIGCALPLYLFFRSCRIS